MKNADMPAMPIELNGFGQYAPEVHMGISKREIFAMNAPDIPSWFIDEWLYNDGNYRVGGSYELVGSSRGANVGIKEMMNITKEWRYAYADLMLGD